jgi:hypothetical protein
MAEIREVEPVKLFVGLLSGYAEALAAAEVDMQARWGAIDLRSDDLPFDFTDYYYHDMGRPLVRRFISFAELFYPAELSAVKEVTNALERDMARIGRWPVARPVNLDPGYVAPSKLVLASCKDYTHRIYLGGGVYAEVTLAYTAGRWQPFDWTYPDYRTAPYQAFFSRVRSALLAARKENPRP